MAASHQSLWGYGIEVAGTSKKYVKQTPTLEAGMYGFKGGEELLGVKSYLYGAWQISAGTSEYFLVQYFCMVLKEVLSDQ